MVSTAADTDSFPKLQFDKRGLDANPLPSASRETSGRVTADGMRGSLTVVTKLRPTLARKVFVPRFKIICWK